MKPSRKIALFCVCIGILLCGAFILFLLPSDNRDPVTPDPVLSKVVGEHPRASEFEALFNGNSAYKIGRNSLGTEVFIDPEKAFEQALIDCKDEFEALRQSSDTIKQTISTSYWVPYYYRSIAVATGEESVIIKTRHASDFLYIYKQSFKLPHE